jgi:hypothetical protein
MTCTLLNVHTGKLLQTETDKWQTRPLVREDAPQRQECNVPTETFRWEIMSGEKPRVGSTPRHIDWLTVSSNVTLLYFRIAPFSACTVTRYHWINSFMYVSIRCCNLKKILRTVWRRRLESECSHLQGTDLMIAELLNTVHEQNQRNSPDASGKNIHAHIHNVYIHICRDRR